MRLSLGSTAYGAKPLDVEDDRTPPVARAVFTAGSSAERFFFRAAIAHAREVIFQMDDGSPHIDQPPPAPGRSARASSIDDASR